jgi:hypothetical protein
MGYYKVIKSQLVMEDTFRSGLPWLSCGIRDQLSSPITELWCPPAVGKTQLG